MILTFDSDGKGVTITNPASGAPNAFSFDHSYPMDSDTETVTDMTWFDDEFKIFFLGTLLNMDLDFHEQDCEEIIVVNVFYFPNLNNSYFKKKKKTQFKPDHFLL